MIRTLALVPLCLALAGSCNRGVSEDPGAGGTGGGMSGSGGGGGGGTTVPASDGGADPFAAARQACVDKINAYRATEGKPPYARWLEAEACSDAEAKSDSETKKAHGAFGMCMELAQNECPGYGPDPNGIINNCLQSMWNEGPGTPFEDHGHYLNMSSTKYKRVACGFYLTPDRKLWALQNFK